MTATAKRWLFWTPRTLGILFAMFISLFALDVFSEHFGFPDVFIAFLMHLIPTLLIVGVLIVAWRWEWVGAAIFSALALAYIITSWGRFPFITYLTICGPLFLLGILFFFNWLHHSELRTR